MNNREKEEKLEVYQNMLRYGQIDETTYRNMVARNIGDDVVNSYNRRVNLKPFIVVVLICLILFGIYKLFTTSRELPSVKKEYEYISSYNNIDSPIQNDFKGSTIVMAGSVPVKVEYVAYYEVSGKVIAKESYYANTVTNIVAQYDVGLVWGKLATDEYLNKIDFNAPGDRFIYWETNDMAWYKLNTSDREITQSFSNNHMITMDTGLISTIKSIKEGDYVRIKGYLANLYWTENNASHNWLSSTVRDDTGDGACEVIYVTDVKWLLEG